MSSLAIEFPLSREEEFLEQLKIADFDWWFTFNESKKDEERPVKDEVVLYLWDDVSLTNFEENVIKLLEEHNIPFYAIIIGDDYQDILEFGDFANDTFKVWVKREIVLREEGD